MDENAGGSLRAPAARASFALTAWSGSTTAGAAVKITATREAALMSKPAVIELRMMAEAVMLFPRMVDGKGRLIAPGVSPTP